MRIGWILMVIALLALTGGAVYQMAGIGTAAFVVSCLALLPKRIRALIATLIVMRESEYGGTMYDYLSGQVSGDMTLLHKWEDDEGLDQAQAIIENAVESGRNYVYLSVVKTGYSRGYMIVHSTKRSIWIRGFIPGIYEPLDAYRNAIDIAKKDAVALGYHPREVS